MRIVVPLAGPDFVGPDGRVKAEQPVGGQPLLRATLEARPWAPLVSADAYVFVFADAPETRAFASGALKDWYPGATCIFLGRHSQGAALSAMAGVAMCTDDDGPLIVDLADIMYSGAMNPLDPVAVFAGDPACGGIALTFESESPGYSYLRRNAAGQVVEAAEKRVISRHASAGTYLFARASVFLKAVAHALENPDGQTYNGLFYVCPLFNGVLASGYSVELSEVYGVVDIKQGVSE